MRNDPQSRILSDDVLGTTDDGWETHMVTKIDYTKGGMSFATYKQIARGYFLIVSIEDRKEERGMSMSRFGLFSSSVSKWLEPAKAFSAKRLAAIVVPPETIAELRALMLAKQAEGQRKDAERKERAS